MAVSHANELRDIAEQMRATVGLISQGPLDEMQTEVRSELRRAPPDEALRTVERALSLLSAQACRRRPRRSLFSALCSSLPSRCVSGNAGTSVLAKNPLSETSRNPGRRAVQSLSKFVV